MASYKVINGLIDLDSLLLADDNERFRYAIELFVADKGKQIKGVTWNEIKRITKTVMIPEYMTVKPVGLYRKRGKDPNLIIDVNDAEQDGLSAELGSSYSSGQVFENLNIHVASPCRTVISGANGVKQRFFNIEIYGNNVAGTGIQIGIDDYFPRSVNTDIDKVQVKDCGTGLEYKNSGNQHFVNRSSFRKNKVGIYIENYGISINNTQIEGNEDAAIRAINSDRIKIDTCYFENGTIELIDSGMITMINSKHSGGLFVSKNSMLINLQSNRLYGFEFALEGSLPTLIIQGNGYQYQRDMDDLIERYKDDEGKLIQNGNYLRLQY